MFIGNANQLHGQECRDINECNTDQIGFCGENSECINKNGTFSCSCYKGFDKVEADYKKRDAWEKMPGTTNRSAFEDYLVWMELENLSYLYG